jgi:mannose-1-phosphate guanylyltransferase
VKAVVLAGGEGTRLRPLTYTTPKPLLPIANRPFLEHQLAWLAGHGVDEVVLSLGYRPDAFAGRFPDGTFYPGTPRTPGYPGTPRTPGAGVRLRYAVEPEPLGTAGAIRFAASGLGSGRLIVCNGDILTDLDLSALVRFHTERGAEATIALTRVEDPSAFGVVPTDEDGRVLGFVEKPAPGAAPTHWVNAGTYVLEPSVLDAIPVERAVSIERETFPGLLEQGRSLYAMPSPAYWLDIGTPAKYLQANADLLAGRAMLAAPDSSVDPAADVTGSVVGARAEVGKGARVLRSVLLEGARVGSGAEVADSVIGAGASVGDGAVVKDFSIVGPGAEVAAGAFLAGARFP